MWFLIDLHHMAEDPDTRDRALVVVGRFHAIFHRFCANVPMDGALSPALG